MIDFLSSYWVIILWVAFISELIYLFIIKLKQKVKTRIINKNPTFSLTDIVSPVNGEMIGLAAVGILILLAYGYWKYSQNKIESLTSEVSVMQSTISTQNSTIDDLQANFKKAQQDLDKLNNTNSDIANSEQKQVNQITSFDKNAKIEETNFNKQFNNIYLNLNKETQINSYKSVGKQ